MSNQVSSGVKSMNLGATMPWSLFLMWYIQARSDPVYDNTLFIVFMFLHKWSLSSHTLHWGPPSVLPEWLAYHWGLAPQVHILCSACHLQGLVILSIFCSSNCGTLAMFSGPAVPPGCDQVVGHPLILLAILAMCWQLYDSKNVLLLSIWWLLLWQRASMSDCNNYFLLNYLLVSHLHACTPCCHC